MLLRDDATLRLVDLWRKETLEGGLRAMLGRGDGVVKFKLNGWRERRWVMGDLGRKERQARIERVPATIAQPDTCLAARGCQRGSTISATGRKQFSIS